MPGATDRPGSGAWVESCEEQGDEVIGGEILDEATIREGEDPLDIRVSQGEARM